jgi:hypothetical protein
MSSRNIVETVDEIAGEDEVVAGVEALQVAGIPLHEGHVRPQLSEAELVERHAPGHRQLPFGGHLVVDLAPLLKPDPRLDEAG